MVEIETKFRETNTSIEEIVNLLTLDGANNPPVCVALVPESHLWGS